MDARTRSAMFMSLLDLVSCALGASIILAVVFAVIETPIPTPKTQDFLSAEFSANSPVKLGLMLYHQQSNKSVLLTPENSHKKYSKDVVAQSKLAGVVNWYSYIKHDNSGTVFSLYIEQPAKGDWLISPYIYSYEDNLTKQQVGKLSVTWRHKNSKSNINCEQEVGNDSWWEDQSKWSDSATGSLPRGANTNSQPDNEGCILNNVSIVHNFS